MAGTIANLAVNIEAGTASFTGPMRDATATLERFGYATEAGRKIFNQTRTDAERYQIQVERLDKQLAKGAISQELYNRAVEQAKAKLDNAGKASQDAASKIDDLNAGFRHMVELVGVIEIARKFTEWAKSSGEAIVQTDHLAKSLGLSTEEMSKLQVAAKLTDTSSEALTTAVGHLEKGLGEIQRGGGKEAADALADLRLNANQLRSESPYAALTEIAEAVRRVEDPSRRTADAMALFGRGGRELIPMLLEGRAGMESFENAAQETGNVISGMDASAVKQASDAVKMLDLQAQGMANTFVVAAAPAVVALSNELRELATAAGAARGGMGSDLSPAIVAVAYVMQTTQLVGQELSLVLLDIAHVGGVLAGTVTSLTSLLGTLAAQITGVGPLLKGLGGPDIEGNLDAMNAKVHDFTDTIGAMHDDIANNHDAAASGASIGDKFLGDYQNAAEGMKSAGRESLAAARGAGALGDAMDDQGEATKKAVDHGRQLVENLKEQIAVFGQTAAQAAVTKATMQGASAADLATAQQLQGQLDKMKAVEATAKLTEKLQEQVQWYGKTAEQVQYLKAQQDLAARGDVVNASKLYLLQNQLDELNAVEATAKLTEKLQEQVQWYGKTAEQVQYLKAQQDLAARGDVVNASKLYLLQNQLDELNANKKAMEDAKHAAEELASAQSKLQESADALSRTHAALTAGSSASDANEAARNAKEMADLQKKLAESHASAADSGAAIDQLERNQAMEHSNKLLEEGARLRESLLSPQQKLNEEMAHYATLLKAGAIDQATYAAAVEKSQESIQKALGETIDSKVFDAANFNFGAFAQLGAPGQGLFGGNPGRRPPGPNGQPPGAPPVPPPLGNSATEETAWRQTMLDLMQKMQPDVHTCAANGSGLVQ